MKKLLFLSIFLFASISAYSQVSNIYPRPQQINVVGDDVFLNNIPVKVIVKGDKLYKKYKSVLPANNEGYYLSTKNGEALIVAHNATGAFYGEQTLNKLYTAGVLPQVEIIDYPNVKYRGVVEGFYGEPWSHADRLDLLSFYGKHKMNTYIYGPKDDQYHSSPYWRKAYPKAEATQIVELIEAAHKHKVDFVWAIHPGKDIKWNVADRDSLLQKFEMMYDLGVRSFAVFFDDISGEGTDPVKQSELLNYIYDHFMTKKPDTKQLIICPTEYNKSWSNPAAGSYLDILGDMLYPQIEIMWTGDRVIADMSKQGMEWINNRIKRKAYVWWNFPVNDYVRDHLLLGQVYGNGLDIEDDMSGFMTNPMERAQASKTSIFSVADYSWNVGGYDSLQSWRAAIKEVMPNVAQAFETFASHNSDLGINGHGYRRKESEMIAPLVQRYLDIYRNENRIDEELRRQISNEYRAMEKAAPLLLASTDNRALIGEIEPWIWQFEQVAKSGNQVLELMQHLDDKHYGDYWKAFAVLKATEDSINYINDHYNRNPYQPGIKTASLVMKPLVDSIVAISGDRFYEALGGKIQQKGKVRLTPQINPVLKSNIYQLRNQPMMVEGNLIKISPLLEVIRVNAKGSFKIMMPYAMEATELRTDFGNADVYNWLVCEITTAGGERKKVSAVDGIYKINEKVLDIEFRSVADKRTEMNLRKVELTTNLQMGSATDLTPMLDGNIATQYGLNAQANVDMDVVNGKELILLFDRQPNLLLTEYNSKGATLKQMVLNDAALIRISLQPETARIKLINSEDATVGIAEVILK